jgi:hypothetical protein
LFGLFFHPDDENYQIARLHIHCSGLRALKDRQNQTFEIFTAATTKSTVFYDVTRCGLLQVYRRFGGSYLLLLADFMVGMLFDPDDGGNMFLQEVNKIHSMTSQKIVLFITQGLYGQPRTHTSRIILTTSDMPAENLTGRIDTPQF